MALLGAPGHHGEPKQRLELEGREGRQARSLRADELSTRAPSERLERDLAPEEQPGYARGAADPAELLAWLTPAVPTGAIPTPPEPAASSPAAAAQVADLVERWARRLSVGVDQRRGVARLDIGEGRFAGAELVVSAEAGHVAVELTLPQPPADSSLSDRIRARLARRGLSADVTVR